jgi:hypothetical protein
MHRKQIFIATFAAMIVGASQFLAGQSQQATAIIAKELQTIAKQNINTYIALAKANSNNLVAKVLAYDSTQLQPFVLPSAQAPFNEEVHKAVVDFFLKLAKKGANYKRIRVATKDADGEPIGTTIMATIGQKKECKTCMCPVFVVTMRRIDATYYIQEYYEYFGRAGDCW